MVAEVERRPERLAPVQPGEILREEFLAPLGVTTYRLARAAGIDPRRIHAIVHGQRSITVETAPLLSRFFENAAAFWMGLQAQHELEVARDRPAARLDAVAAHPPR